MFLPKLPLCAAALMLPSSPEATVPAPDEFSSVRDRYGNIDTIAGSGANDSCNDWLAIYDGGIATSADLPRPEYRTALWNSAIEDGQSAPKAFVCPRLRLG